MVTVNIKCLSVYCSPTFGYGLYIIAVCSKVVGINGKSLHNVLIVALHKNEYIYLKYSFYIINILFYFTLYS